MEKNASFVPETRGVRKPKEAEMKITQVLPGCFHLQGEQEAALLSSPPEILKFLLRRKLPIPHVGIIPDTTHTRGVSKMAFEFLGYWFLFVEQGYQKGGKFRILGTPGACMRLYEILRLTLLGPSREEMKRWGLSKHRIEFLSKLSQGMALQKEGKVQQIEDFFEFVHFPEEAGGEAVPLFAQDDSIRVRRLGENRYEFSEGGNKTVLSAEEEGDVFPPLADLSNGVEKPEKFRLKVLGCYSGFDPEGPTTGMLLWVNANAFLIDVPAGIEHYLRQVGISRKQLTAVIQTHIHDDHSHLSELILSERVPLIITTREIFECAVRKAAHVLGESPEVLKAMVRFQEVIPGKNYEMFGARWEFFYTVHPIPTVGFRVAVKDESGKAHVLLHSSDMDNFKDMDRLVEKGALPAEYRDRMKKLVRGDEDLVTLDGGGGLIHGEPEDWAPFQERYPKTHFLFYHVNPAKVDTTRFQTAKPGWEKTLLSAGSFSPVVYSGVISALKLFQVKDPSWINVILTQGNVVEMDRNAEIVKKGQEGDAFYFVLAGNVEVYDTLEKRPTLLARLEAGDFFGEMSLINQAKRNATVVAATGAVLFRLPGDLFLEFVEKNDLKECFIQIWKRRPLISSVALFRDLTPRAKHEISLLAHPDRFKKGELIFRQGSKSDEFYILSSGKVEIFRVGDSGRKQVLAQLRAGDFFGENVALGYTDRRNASAKALSDVQALVLKGPQLRDLARKMPILRHQLHVVMKQRGVRSDILQRAVQIQLQ